MRIGYFGGSFNPPTTAHIQVAEKVIESCDIDEVWLAPCYKSLYGKSLAENHHREEMVLRACESSLYPDQIRLCSWELTNRIEGKTFDIMELMTGIYSQHELSFIIGGDNVDKVPQMWYRGEDLIQKYNFITIPRKGYKPKTDWWRKDGNQVAGSDANASDVSSTEVKRQLNESDDELAGVKGLDPLVYRYIIEHNLYKGE